MRLPDGREVELPKKSLLIREVIDKHEYRGRKIRDLSRKKLMRVVDLLLMYLPQLEGMAKYFETEWKKSKESEKQDE
jgi:hypothetical protein